MNSTEIEAAVGFYKHSLGASESQARLLATAPVLLDALEEIYAQVNGANSAPLKWIRNRAGEAIRKAKGDL